MAVEIARIGVTLDTSGVKSGAADVQTASQQVKSSANVMVTELSKVGTTSSMTAQAAAALAKQEQELAAQTQQAAKALREMGLASDQINVALRKMGLGQVKADTDKATTATERMTKALLDQNRVIQQLQRAGGSTSGAGYAALVNTSGQGFGSAAYLAGMSAASRATTVAGQSAAAAAPNFGKLQNALQQLALASVGVPGPIGGVAKALSSLVVGGVGGLGVVAVVAGVAAALDKIQAPARKAAEEIKKLNDEYDALMQRARDQNADGLRKGITDAAAAAATAYRQIQALRQSAANLDRLAQFDQGAAAQQVSLLAQAARLEEGRVASVKEIVTLTDKLVNLQNDSNAKAIESARRSQSFELLVAEQNALVAQARLRRDGAAEEKALMAIRAAEIENRIRSMDQLTALEKERLRTALQAADAAERETKALEARAKMLKDLAIDASVVGLRATVGGRRDFTPVRNPGIDRLNERYDRVANSAGIDGLSDTAKALQFEINKIIEAEQRRVDAANATAQAVEEQVEAERRRIELMRQATYGITELAQQLWGLDAATASAINAVADLATGIATKDPAMIISGGLNLIGSIFGDGGRKERQQAREARAAQLDDINRFIDSIAPPKTDIDALVASYQALHAEGKRLGLGNHELARLTQAYANELQRLHEVERLRNAQMEEDLQVRALLAQGHNAEAEALRFAIEQQREYAAAVEDGYSEATLATLAHVQALEAEAEALRVAREELELFRQRTDLSADFAERSARVSGNTAGADLIAIDRRFTDEWNRIQDLVRDGVLSVGEAAEWQALIERERKKAIDDVTASIREQQEAMALLVRNTEEDLRVRELRALGLDDEADALQRTIENERELQRLRDQGLPESVIAYAKYVQELEEAKRQTEALTKAVEEMAAQLKREAEFMDDLNVRRLRATGQGGAADEAAMYARQQREIDDAIAQGFSEAAIATLRSVQDAERADFRARREQAQLDAFKAAADHNFSLTDPFAEASRTTQSLAVGITGSQADRIAGMLTSQLVVQTQNLPSLPQIVQRLDRLVVLVARSSGLTAEQVEAYLTETEAASERALGINPSNR